MEPEITTELNIKKQNSENPSVFFTGKSNDQEQNLFLIEPARLSKS